MFQHVTWAASVVPSAALLTRSYVQRGCACPRTLSCPPTCHAHVSVYERCTANIHGESTSARLRLQCQWKRLLRLRFDYSTFEQNRFDYSYQYAIAPIQRILFCYAHSYLNKHWFLFIISVAIRLIIFLNYNNIYYII